jgi:hypothetical protein
MATSNRLRYCLCLALTGFGGALAAQFSPVTWAATAARFVFAPTAAGNSLREPQLWPMLQFDFGDELIEFSVVGMQEKVVARAPVLELQGCGERQLRFLHGLDPHQRFRLLAPGLPVQWFQVTDHRLVAANRPIAMPRAPGTVMLRCHPADRMLSPRHLGYLVTARSIEPVGGAGPAVAAATANRMH